MSTQEAALEVNSFKNENLSVKVSRFPRCQIQFDIEVEPRAVQAAHLKAVKNVSKEVIFPGFRKGKAPQGVIEERYPEAIHKEWLDIVVHTAFNDALRLSHTYPYKEGTIQRPVMHSCSQEEGAKLTIKFETRPVIPSINLNALHLDKVEVIPVTPQEKEEALERVRMQCTTFEPIKDRPVQEGDFVDLELTLLSTPPRKVIDNARIEVSKKMMPHWVQSKVIGLQEGETGEGVTEPDAEHVIENFQVLPFVATVNAIWKGQIPEMDDALAKSVGLQTVDELKQKIEEKLLQAAESEAYDKQVAQLENLLLKSYPIDLPASLIEQNKQARLEEYLQELKKEGESFDPSFRPQVEQQIEASTLKGLTLFFLLHKVADDHAIAVSDKDLMQEISRQLSLIPSGKSQFDFTQDKEEMRRQMHSMALNKKVKDFLIEKALSHPSQLDQKPS